MSNCRPFYMFSVLLQWLKITRSVQLFPPSSSGTTNKKKRYWNIRQNSEIIIIIKIRRYTCGTCINKSFACKLGCTKKRILGSKEINPGMSYAYQDVEVPLSWLAVTGSSVLAIWEASDSLDSLLKCPLRVTLADPWLFQTAESRRIKSLLQTMLRLLACKNVKSRDVSVKKCPKGLFPLARNLLSENEMPGHSERKSLSNRWALNVVGTIIRFSRRILILIPHYRGKKKKIPFPQ